MSENNRLDRQIYREEIAQCVKKQKNNDWGVVGELLKYGGSGMVYVFTRAAVFLVPWQWQEGLIVNLFKKGDKEDPGNYPRRACARDMVLGLCVCCVCCVCVCLSVCHVCLSGTTSPATTRNEASNRRYLQLRRNLGNILNMEFSLNMLCSKVMA